MPNTELSLSRDQYLQLEAIATTHNTDIAAVMDKVVTAGMLTLDICNDKRAYLLVVEPNRTRKIEFSYNELPKKAPAAPLSRWRSIGKTIWLGVCSGARKVLHIGCWSLILLSLLELVHRAFQF